MKKKIAALLLILVLALTACGKTNTADNTDEEEPIVEQPMTEAEKAMALYKDFLDGNAKVTVKEDDYELKAGNSYTIDEIATAFIEDDEWKIIGDFTLDHVSYTYTDPDKDGIKMLGVMLSYSMGDSSWDTDRIILIKAVGDELKYVMQAASVYRTEAMLYHNGVIRTGGADSAMSYGMTYYMADAKGNKKFLYDIYYYMGLTDTIIPDAYLPSDIDKADYPDYLEYIAEDDYSYSFVRINLAEYDYTNTDSSYYNDFVRNKSRFCFVSPEGEYIPASENFNAWYVEAGLKILSEEEAENLIPNILAENGIDNQDFEETPVQWKVLK
ncbi:MAG: hypothetical protein J5876_04320 [Lachnospiraceae bacterium]|nr:hypothetical protein [Lachnospiraceae bacterium]